MDLGLILDDPGFQSLMDSRSAICGAHGRCRSGQEREERSDLLSLCARILAARRLLHRKEVWRDIP
jgi:hypothetical protein